jgi:hypothetical protein
MSHHGQDSCAGKASMGTGRPAAKSRCTCGVILPVILCSALIGFAVFRITAKARDTGDLKLSQYDKKQNYTGIPQTRSKGNQDQTMRKSSAADNQASQGGKGKTALSQNNGKQQRLHKAKTENGGISTEVFNRPNGQNENMPLSARTQRERQNAQREAGVQNNNTRAAFSKPFCDTELLQRGIRCECNARSDVPRVRKQPFIAEKWRVRHDLNCREAKASKDIDVVFSPLSLSLSSLSLSLSLFLFPPHPPSLPPSLPPSVPPSLPPYLPLQRGLYNGRLARHQPKP